MTREELYKSAKSILYEDFCLNGKCPYHDQCERGEGHVPAHKLSCNHDFALSMIIKGVELAINSQKSPWIRVEDDLPCNNHNFIHFGFTNRVLVRNKNGDLFVAYMKKNKDNEWIWCNDTDDKFDLLSDITYWMPIPNLPKE